MAGFNYAQNIIGFKKSGGDIHELELEVAQLSASVLSIELDVADLSASVLTIGEKLEDATTYSTDEKIVGTWVDDSPIYEKTFSDVLPTIADNVFSTKTIDTTALNIDLVVDYDFFIIQTINNNKLTVKMPYITNSGLQLKGFYDGNAKNINISSNASVYSECQFYATLRYIKATE